MAGSTLFLRPLTPGDHDEVFRWANTPGLGDHWRLGDGPSKREHLDSDLWRGVLRHDLVCSSVDRSPIALATAYDANLRNGTVWLAVISHPDHVNSGLAMAGAGLFIDSLFREWPFRMVRLEAFAFTFERFASLGRIARLDGVLRADRWWNGAHHDQVLLSITRESWQEHKTGPLGSALRRISAPAFPAPGVAAHPPIHIAAAT